MADNQNIRSETSIGSRSLQADITQPPAGNGQDTGNRQGRGRNALLYTALAASLAGNAWEVYQHHFRGTPATQVQVPNPGPQTPPTPQTPETKYQDMRYRAVERDDMTHIVLDQYLGAKTHAEAARKNLQYNPNLSLDSRLEPGTVVHLSFNAGVDPRRNVDYKAKQGETYKGVVQRAVDDLVKQVITRNKLTSDVYTTMPYGEVRKLGLEDKMRAVGGVKTLDEVTDNTPILLERPDRIQGDIIKPGDELVLPGIRVPEGTAPVSRTYEKTSYFSRLKLEKQNDARHGVDRSIRSPHAREAYGALMERYSPNHLRDAAPRIPLSR